MFGTFHKWTNADTVGLNSELILNLHLFFVHGRNNESGKATHLHRLDCHTMISNKIKCASLFDLLFTLNQAKLDML